MIPVIIVTIICRSNGCYKAADIIIYRNKKKVYVCKEHSQQPKKDKQLELFNESYISTHKIR